MSIRTILVVMTLVVVPATVDARPPGQPSDWGYNLDEPVGGYFGGGRYTEYYGYGRGPLSIANYPGPVPYWPGYEAYLGPPPRRYYRPTVVFVEPRPAPCHVVVWVPADAEVWFDGFKTTQPGEAREFVSDPMPAGKHSSYHVKARWKGPDGKEVEQEQVVPVTAGERAAVRFPAEPR